MTHDSSVGLTAARSHRQKQSDKQWLELHVDHLCIHRVISAKKKKKTNVCVVSYYYCLLVVGWWWWWWWCVCCGCYCCCLLLLLFLLLHQIHTRARGVSVHEYAYVYACVSNATFMYNVSAFAAVCAGDYVGFV